MDKELLKKMAQREEQNRRHQELKLIKEMKLKELSTVLGDKKEEITEGINSDSIGNSFYQKKEKIFKFVEILLVSIKDSTGDLIEGKKNIELFLEKLNTSNLAEIITYCKAISSYKQYGKKMNIDFITIYDEKTVPKLNNKINNLIRSVGEILVKKSNSISTSLDGIKEYLLKRKEKLIQKEWKDIIVKKK